ncbi:MAG: ribosome-associated translation inhibitor RaiA [Bacteroidota bacterium]|nr:ribosome-associated translation inhibitor RaiA [Bacteroidota bacterium]
MKIDIHAKNINVWDTLNDLILKKVGKLQNFHAYIINTDVYLRNEGEGVNSKEVQIKVNVKDHTLVCKENSESFEKALESATSSMERQLKKSKQK